MDCPNLVETPLGDGKSKYHCEVCGRTTTQTSGKRIRRRCRKPEVVAAMKRERLLGDLAADLIERTGMADGYKMIRGWLEGLPSAEVNCGGCKDRQEWLNRLHERWNNWRGADGAIT